MPFIQILHNDSSQIEDAHLLFCAHFVNIFSIFRDVEQTFFSPKMLRWCLVCVICNSNSFYLFICSHIEDVHLPFCVHLINIF